MDSVHKKLTLTRRVVTVKDDVNLNTIIVNTCKAINCNEAAEGNGEMAVK